MEPHSNLEDTLISILVALARHSPQSANAILRCPQLIQAVAKVLMNQRIAEISSSQIKVLTLLKVRLIFLTDLHVMYLRKKKEVASFRWGRGSNDNNYFDNVAAFRINLYFWNWQVKYNLYFMLVIYAENDETFMLYNSSNDMKFK
jgi:hypothetical protein